MEPAGGGRCRHGEIAVSKSIDSSGRCTQVPLVQPPFGYPRSAIVRIMLSPSCTPILSLQNPYFGGSILLCARMTSNIQSGRIVASYRVRLVGTPRTYLICQSADGGAEDRGLGTNEVKEPAC